MSKLKKNNIQPLYKYHPVRFTASREPYITDATNILSRNCFNGAHPIFSLPPQTKKEIDSCFDKLIINHITSSTSKELYPSYLQKMYQMCEKYFMLGYEDTAEMLSGYLQSYLNDDLITFQQHTSFCYYGSNIFDFPPHLLELFAQTDVDSVLLKDIRLPFSTIYVHFGKQDIKVYGNISYIIEKCKLEQPSTANNQDIHFLLDGAYVSQCPETNCLKVVFTSRRNKFSKDTINPHGKTSGLRISTNCIDDYEEVICMVLKPTSDDTNIYDTVEVVRNLLLNNKIYQTSELLLNTIINQIVDYLKLTINCILYLQSYPEDITEDYPESAPSNLVAQTKRNSGVKAIAEKKLNQLGYRKIKFCGNRRPSITINDTEPSYTTDEDKQTKQPHRRRTHLRKQRYGKGLESWRYIWIKEAIIHKDKYEPSQQYRIYEVSQNMAPEL